KSTGTIDQHGPAGCRTLVDCQNELLVAHGFWPPPIAVMVMSPCYRNGRGARGWGPYRTGVAPGVPTGVAAGDASGEATGVAGTGVDSGVAGTGDGLAATVSPRQSNRVFQVWKYMSGTYPWIS